jgi:hypothetical protein
MITCVGVKSSNSVRSETAVKPASSRPWRTSLDGRSRGICVFRLLSNVSPKSQRFSVLSYILGQVSFGAKYA